MIAPTSFFADYGCHVRILEEALVLQKLGNRVTICTYHNGRDIAGLDIRRTMSIPWRTAYEVGSSRHKMGFDVLLLQKALSVALQTKPDVVHGHLHEGALIGYFVSKLLGVPLVFDFQGSMTGEMIDHHFLNPKGLLYRPARWLEQAIVGMPSAIITSSRHAEELLISDFSCPREKVTPIPDCVNADSFSPQQSRASTLALKASLGIPPERRVVVYLGLLAEWQGTGLLLQAAAQLTTRQPDVQFMIMGFPGVDAYRQQAYQLGLNNNVTFTGKIPYEQAPQFLALGDVAVAPKTSATEGSGKLLNYMAMGLPTVAFDVPVSREYLGDLGGYARPGEADSLAEALETLLVERERARMLGQELRNRAIEHYSWTTAGERILQVYDRVCAQSQE
jgi:glycosyltransferase involved in cell wall biosynthesis